MKAFVFVLLLLGMGLCSVQSDALARADNSAPKVVKRLDLPFTDGGQSLREGWIGLSPNGDYLVAYYTTPNSQSHLVIWDTAKWSVIAKPKIGKGATVSRDGPPATFTPSGTRLVYTTRNEIHFYNLDLETPQQTQAIEASSFPCMSDEIRPFLAIAPGRKKITRFANIYDTLWIEDVYTDPTPKVVGRGKLEVEMTRMAVSEDQSILAWTKDRHTILLRKLENDNMRPDDVSKLTPTDPTISVSVLRFNGNASMLASGSTDGSLTIWDVAKKRESIVVRVPWRGKTVSAIAFSPDETYVASGSFDNNGFPNAQVVSVKTGNVRYKWSDNKIAVFNLAFNRSGSRLAVLGGTTISVYDVSESVN